MTFRIAEQQLVAERTYRIVLEGDTAGIDRPGQFVHVSVPGFFLRRPISVHDCAEGRLVLLYKTAGEGTKAMSRLPAGDRVDVLTGLGSGFHPERCVSAALLAGGGLGAAPLYWLAKQLRGLGREVTAVLGFNKASEIVLAREFEAIGCRTAVATLDGSQGMKGLVTDAIAALRADYDYFYTCGPKPMMQAVCRTASGPGEASLEERMGCGAGICYGCTVQTASGPRRVCREGPVFGKEEIVW